MVVFVSLLFSVLLATPQSATKPEPKRADLCTLEGVVVAAEGGAPLQKAWVSLQNPDTQEESKGALTDASGRFVVKNVQPGRYRLSAGRNGYVNQPYGQKEPGQPGTILALAPGQQVRDLSIRLIRAAAISGHVYDEDGEPLLRARVSAMVYGYSRGQRQLMSRNMTTTDDLGEYRIFGLPPGQYYVSAGYQTLPYSRDGLQVSYGTSFYPGTADPAAATPITLRAGDDYPGVDFSLQPAKSVTVSGRVFNGITGQPGVGANLYLTARSRSVPGFFAFGSQAYVQNREGDFKLTGVSPGAYYLVAMIESGGRPYVSRLSLDVGDSDVEGVNVVITRGIDLRGRIRIEGKVDLAGLEVYLAPREQGIYLGVNSAAIDSDGTFALNGASDGSYDVNVQHLPDYAYVKAVMVGGDDILLKGLEISGGQSPGPLEIVLSGNAGRIEGTVSKDLKAASSAEVILLPDDPELRQKWWGAKQTSTDQYGRFTLQGVRPGDYKIYAFEKIEPGAYLDPSFMKPFQERGVAVHIEEGGTRAVQLELIPAEKTSEPVSQ